MVDARAQRIARRMRGAVPMDVIERLVAAGLDSPRKIKAADDKAIEAIKGIGKATKDKIREHIPKFKKAK